VERRKPQVLWEPDEAFAQRTRLRAYGDWLSALHGVDVTTYAELWEWSTGDIEGFWSSIAEYFGVLFRDAPQAALESAQMPGARWLRARRSPIPSTSSAVATATPSRSAMPPSCARSRR
jgi:acetoacetyl-CoA synthetase